MIEGGTIFPKEISALDRHENGTECRDLEIGRPFLLEMLDDLLQLVDRQRPRSSPEIFEKAAVPVEFLGNVAETLSGPLCIGFGKS